MQRNEHGEHGDPTFLSQLESIRRAFEAIGLQVSVLYDAEGAPLAVYVEDQLLVEPEAMDRARDTLPPWRSTRDRRGGPVLCDFRQHPRRRSGEPSRALELMDLMGREGCSLNHIVSIDPVGTCPAQEPAPAGFPINPEVNPDAQAGAGIRVLVVDSGLVETFADHPWLAADVDGEIEDLTDPGDPEILREYVAHGQFIAGVVKCVAPASSVRVSGALRHAGALDEFQLGSLLLDVVEQEEAERGRWPDIISLSAGVHTMDDQPLMGLEVFMNALAAHEDTTLVAAAGNHNKVSPYWPAACGTLPTPNTGVVSVGALREDGMGLACFSNHGPWVNVYAPGERLVNAFVSGTYKYHDPAATHCRYHPDPVPYAQCTCVTAPVEGSTADFTGLAEWSGTSFSTPIVAAMIAVRMVKTKENSRQAAAALLAGAGTVQGAGKTLLPIGWSPTYSWAK
jgi:subtilase family protein